MCGGLTGPYARGLCWVVAIIRGLEALSILLLSRSGDHQSMSFKGAVGGVIVH